MNRGAWSDEDRAEYDQIVSESWSISPSQSNRTNAFLSKLRDAEQELRKHFKPRTAAERRRSA